MRKKLLRLLLYFGLVLGGLLLVGWGFENWRGGSEWQQAKERAAQMGVSLKLSEYEAEPIAEGDRLMEDPVFLAEWNQEISPRLARFAYMTLEGVQTKMIRYGSVSKGKVFSFSQFFEEEITEEEAVLKFNEIYEPVVHRLQRLGAVILENSAQDMTIRTVDFSSDESISSVLTLKKISGAFRDLGLLSLRNGDAKTALWACRVVARLGENFSQPALINLIVSDSVLLSLESVIWEGVRLHQWSAEDLDQLALLFPTEPAYEEVKAAIEYETALVDTTVDQVEEMSQKMNNLFSPLFGEEEKPSLKDRVQHWMNYCGPEGWQDWRKATVLNEWLDTLENREQWRVLGQKGRVIHIDMDDPSELSGSFHPLAKYRGDFLGVSGLIETVQRNATRRRIVRIGIELEKVYLREGRYLDLSDEITFPFSIVDLSDSKGRELKYEKSDDGYFTIWSERARENERGTRPRGWKFTEKKKTKGKKGKKRSE